MTIIIDTREQKRAKLMEYLADYSDVGFWPEKLDHGADYLIENESQLAIQRKSVNDFCNSIGDGLKDTLYELRSNHELSALLLEGSYRVVGNRIGTRRGGKVVQTIRLSSAHNFILSQQLRGTMFFWTADLKDTAYLLADAHSYLDGSVSASTTIDSPEEFASLVPNIGPKRVESLSRNFDGDWLQAFQGFPERWAEADGIGPATVDEIRAWLRDES